MLKQLVSLTTAVEKLTAAVAEGMGRVGAESGPGSAPRGKAKRRRVVEESDDEDGGRVMGAPFGGSDDDLDAVLVASEAARKATEAEARAEAEVIAEAE